MMALFVSVLIGRQMGRNNYNCLNRDGRSIFAHNADNLIPAGDDRSPGFGLTLDCFLKEF